MSFAELRLGNRDPEPSGYKGRPTYWLVLRLPDVKPPCSTCRANLARLSFFVSDRSRLRRRGQQHATGMGRAFPAADISVVLGESSVAAEAGAYPAFAVYM